MKILIVLFISVYAFCIEVQKPKVYKGNENIKNWLMSEKLDGIRGVWDGEKLLTRKGKKIFAPKWFIKDFPPFYLDGELWSKRADFENIQNIVMDKTPTKYWKNITYNIFEVPKAKGDFLQRLEKIKKWLRKHPNKYIKVIKQIKVKNKKHLDNFLNKIIAKNGEGLIVRDSKKDFFTGRSSFILKVKKTQDMEGKVIAINISQKTKVLKSLSIELKNGIKFNLGTGFNKNQRENPPKVGSFVTFKYFGLTKKGKPRFASFLHVRKD